MVDGYGTMILDGQPFEMGPGDVSLVKPGHTHGLVNSSDGPMRADRDLREITQRNWGDPRRRADLWSCEW